MGIVRTVLDGHPAAFGVLVDRYQARLMTSLVYVTSDQHLAEDICQEAFVKAFSHLTGFRGGSSFYTWLYRIALNQLATWRRARSRREIPQSTSATLNLVVDPGADADDELVRREQIEAVRRAMDALSDEHRQVIVLREIDGCNYEEIADILQMSVGTVRSRLHRARQQLYRILHTKVDSHE
jgi:RNA polymerase sigma-70 factor (ECF subfamily)